MRRLVTTFLSMILLAALSTSVFAQRNVAEFDASNARKPIDLGETKWFFHEGDDPAWSEADFNDSEWKVVDPSQPLSTYADARHGSVFWYRLHIRLDPTMTDPALGEILVARALSLYADGRLLAQIGGAPGHEMPMYSPPAVFHLSKGASKPTAVVLAIRCVLFNGARSIPRPLVAPGKLLLGRFDELETKRELNLLSGNIAYWALLVLELTVGLLALALYRTQRQQRDYFWIALLGLDQALTTSLACVGAVMPTSRALYGVLAPLFDAGLMLGLLGFYMAFARRRFDWWARTVCVCAAVDCVVGVLNFDTTWMPDSLALVLLALYYSPLTLFPFVSLVRAVRHGDREARLMLLPFTFLAVEFYWRIGSAALSALGVVPDSLFVSGFSLFFLNLNSRMCVGLLFWFTILALMVLRSNRLSRDNARIAAEVEAARQVQQVLLPDPSAQVAGFATQSVYLPASQVGGDFFQLHPTLRDGEPDGGLLIVVGDVAGKGLSAAMLVSVLVGAIRAESAHSTDPGRLLAALNRTLLGQAGGGFATCLCALIDADGQMTIANAGHLSPYLDGSELELAGALPLGILTGVDYESSSMLLEAGSRLTFYSDGVPEAQDEAGNLLGFDRARELSSQTAEAIAMAASDFGQTDDITVLTVTWTGTSADVPEELAA